MIGIYKITSPSNKIYIGQAKNINRRFYEYSILHCKNQIRLYRSLKKYGVENHIFEIVEKCLESELNERERYWQEYYDVLNRYKGLNCMYVETDIKKREMSKETRDKISMKNKISHKGKKLSEKHKENIGNKIRGKKRSESYKKKRRYNTQSKIILNIETGIYYECIRDAAESINMERKHFNNYLLGKYKTKKIPFIYA